MRGLLVVAGLIGSSGALASPLTLKTADGLQVAADTAGRGSRCVVLVHDAERTRQDWSHFAERLANNDIRSVSIDLRGHGETPGELTDESYPEMTAEIVAAVDHLRKRGCSEVSLVGARLGANLALRVAADDPEIDNLILLSAGLSVKGIRVASALEAYGDRPVLFVASEDDAVGSKAAGLLAEKATGDVHVALLTEAGVGTVMLNRAPELEGLILSWLNGTFHTSQGEGASERDLKTGEVSDIETTGTKYGDRD